MEQHDSFVKRPKNVLFGSQLSRIIQEVGALSIRGNIFARTRAHSERQPDRSIFLANIERFNLSSCDAVEVLHVTPPGNAVWLRSQEDTNGIHFEINRFDYLVHNSSLMRLFFETYY
jgi:hypothetical protein